MRSSSGRGSVISPRDAGAGLEAVVGEAARSGRSVTQTAGSMRGRSGSLEGGDGVERQGSTRGALPDLGVHDASRHRVS